MFLRNFIFHFLNNVLALLVIAEENLDHFLLVLLLGVFEGFKPFFRFLIVAFIVVFRLLRQQLIETFVLSHFIVVVVTLLGCLLLLSPVIGILTRLFVVHDPEVGLFLRVLLQLLIMHLQERQNGLLVADVIHRLLFIVFIR